MDLRKGRDSLRGHLRSCRKERSQRRGSCKLPNILHQLCCMHGMCSISHTISETISDERIQTERQQDGTHAPDNFGLLNLPLYITSKGMGNFDFNELSPAPSFSVPAKKELELEPFSPTMRVDDNYLANDGVVPTFSQWHPLPCR